MIGKITVIKSLIIPNVTFLASVSHIEKQKRKNKRTVLSFEKLDGGLKMINIDKYKESIKIGWIKKLITGDLNNWKIIPLFYCNKFGKDFLIYHMNIDNIGSIPELKMLPEFYLNIVKARITNRKVQQPKNFRSIYQEVIWGNHFIKIKNKCLLLQNWIYSNIIYVNDVIDKNGNIEVNLILKKLKIKKK